MESVPRHGHREIATPLDGFHEAGGKGILQLAGYLLQ
jgi:hypothetical protein